MSWKVPLGEDTTPLMVRFVSGAAPMVTFLPSGAGLPSITGPAQVLLPSRLVSDPGLVRVPSPAPLSVRNSLTTMKPIRFGSESRSCPAPIRVWLTIVPLATVPAAPRASLWPTVSTPLLTVVSPR